MDIKITDKSLRYFLQTDADQETIAQKVSLCGPTFDRLTHTDKDTVYEIEVITNRVDTASAQGIARESSAILNQLGIPSKMKNDPYEINIDLYKNLAKTFNFNISGHQLVRSFAAVSLENITVQESPIDTVHLLEQCGERSINNLVDITNELTLLYGMPSHIFDLDKLGAQKITIRESQEGEIVFTLDDKKNTLKGGDIVMEDGTGQLIDLCGIMGGSVAEVDEHTKNILLIVPVYEPKKIRRTSLYLQKRTLASQIYEKQPDTKLCLPVLTRAISLFKERAKARVSSSVFLYDTPVESKNITLDTNWLNRFIGIVLPFKTIISILNSLGFQTKKINSTTIDCTIPSWRTQDINIKEDLAEEISRVYGYFRLPATIPAICSIPEAKNPLISLESKIKTNLANKGFNEIYNSSLISAELISSTRLSTPDHLELKNALSEDFKYLRTSLIPSLLQNIKNNQGKSEEPYFLFEISNIYKKTKETLPNELSRLGIVSTQDYPHIKGQIESLFIDLNVPNIKFTDAKNKPNYLHPNKTAQITSSGKTIGLIGFVEPSILHALNITSDPIVCEIDLPEMVNCVSAKYIYKPISEYPEISESITVTSALPIGDIIEKISSADKLINRVVYSNSFQNKHTFKVSFVSHSKNLTQAEVNDVKNKLSDLFN